MTRYFILRAKDKENNLVMQIECVDTRLITSHGEKYSVEEAEKFVCEKFIKREDISFGVMGKICDIHEIDAVKLTE